MVICIVMVMNLELNNITVKESNLSKAKRNHVICIPEPVPGGGGDSHMERTGMLVGNFEFNP